MAITTKLKPHGTYAAARRHERKGEKPCIECAVALAARQRDYYHKRKNL